MHSIGVVSVSEMNLTQVEADALLAMEKFCTEEKPYRSPEFGGKIIIPLSSLDERENFTLDIHRSSLKLEKGTYQHRGRRTIILARLDFGGPPHRNPDGNEVGVPHLHLYREGYGDKWAFSLPQEPFAGKLEPWHLLTSFMIYCQIVRPPKLDRGLFS